MPRGPGQTTMYGSSGHYVSHSKLQSPLTIQWLNENYEVSEGVSLPRSALYSHYLDFCEKNNLSPVNAASFGKIIRHTFPNLKTRRLGTRGQSKYHYYGITIKATSPYHDTVCNAARQSNTGFSQSYSKNDVEERHQGSGPHKGPQGNGTYVAAAPGGTLLPDFPKPSKLTLPEDVPHEKVKTFLIMYRAHCQRILDTILRANFGEVQNFLVHFWQGMPSHMLEVLGCNEVVELIGQCDSILYKAISGVLIPGTLQPLPASLTQAIRQFAQQLDEWLIESLSHLPEPLQKKKLAVAKNFSHSLRRQTSLTHLAQAARTVLHSAEPVSQMLNDWKQIDFEGITRQALWTFNNEMEDEWELIYDHFKEFTQLLEQQATIDQYAEWASSMVNRCISKQVEKTGKTFKECSRHFLLKWSFFSVKIVRELTLHSAHSFGSFHLLHMLLEDYILYTVENHNNADEQLTQSTVCATKETNFAQGDVKEDMDIDVARPRPTSVRKSGSRKHSSSSSVGSLRSPREVVAQRSPAQTPTMMRSSYHDMSPHAMTPMTPTTPTNNNNNISKYSMIPEPGHFLYPSPGDYGTRYGYTSAPGNPMTSVNHGSSYSATGTSDAAIGMGDFDMSSSYTTDGTSYTIVRSKNSMADSSYAVMTPAPNIPGYEYRGVSPIDQFKHYSQYPPNERSYPSSYMFPASAVASNTMYPISGVSGGPSERYYPDVLEEFVDMQAAMHHGIPSRPVRSQYSYAPAILSN
ncbi:regulatory factor X 4-like isoform X2 [Montipora capricornis]